MVLFVTLFGIALAAGECETDGSCPVSAAKNTNMLQATKSELVQANEQDTKTIYVKFESLDDTANAADKILAALEEAGLSLDEWQPTGAHHIPDHESSFPVDMDMQFEPKPPPAPEPEPSPHWTYKDDFVDEEALLQEEQEEEEDLSFNQTLVDELMEGAEKSKYKKQKNWAARQISKLEAPVCSRYRERKYAAYARSSYIPWWSCASGWEYIWGICYKNCASGWYGAWFLCHQSCGAREDTWSECIERCRDVPGDPSPLDTTCSLFYCGQSSGDCAEHGAKIALSFAEMFANFIPGGKAMTGLKKAVKKGTMAAMKAAMKKAVKDIAKKMLKKARKNLKKEIKSRGKELREEVKEAILQGGAEQVAEVFIAKTDGDYLAETAVEILKAVDPTGISDVVGAFEADRCRDKIIDDMPPVDDYGYGGKGGGW